VVDSTIVLLPQLDFACCAAPTGLRTITAAGRAARRPWWLLDAAFPPTVDP